MTQVIEVRDGQVERYAVGSDAIGWLMDRFAGHHSHSGVMVIDLDYDEFCEEFPMEAEGDEVDSMEVVGDLDTCCGQWILWTR